MPALQTYFDLRLKFERRRKYLQRPEEKNYMCGCSLGLIKKSGALKSMSNVVTVESGRPFLHLVHGPERVSSVNPSIPCSSPASSVFFTNGSDSIRSNNVHDDQDRSERFFFLEEATTDVVNSELGKNSCIRSDDEAKEGLFV